MITSYLENNKCGYSTRRSMYVRVVTILAISALFILYFPPSYAVTTVIWDSQGYTFFDSTPGNVRVFFTITDDSKANNGAVETITATVTSIKPDGSIRDSIEITLSEVTLDPPGFGMPEVPDPDSGVFRNTNLIFSDGALDGEKEYSVGDTITFRVDDSEGNFFGFFADFFVITTDGTIDTITGPTFNVISSSDTVTFIDTFPITEIGEDTQIYTGTLQFSELADFGSGTIRVQPGDILTIIEFLSGSTGVRNSLIAPNPDPSVGVIRTAFDDRITVTYNGIECVDVEPVEGVDDLCDTAVNTAGAPGAGSGGPVLPSLSLVFDTLAGISSIQSIIGAGGGGHDKTPPSLTRAFSSTVQFDPFTPIASTSSLAGTTAQPPLRINQNGYNLYGYSNTIVTNTIETGQFTDMSLAFNEASKVEHVAMYFVDNDKAEHSDTDPALIFDKGNIVKVDPQGIFGDDIQMSTSKEGTKSTFNFGMSFDKPTNKHIIIVAWDDKRNAGTTKVFNALQVVGNIIPDQVAHFMPIEVLGEFDLIKDDNGQYVLSEPVKTETVTNSPKSIVYPDFIGRMERHDAASLYNVIYSEQQKAADIISSKMNVDNNLFSIKQDTKLIDHSKRAPQLSSCGKYLGCELDREDKDMMKTLMWQEHLKAEKILVSLIKSQRHY